MVLTFEQDKELEQLKHKQKLELLTMQEEYSKTEHTRKMLRLEQLLKIAEAGGKPAGEV